MDKLPNEILSKIFWHVSNDNQKTIGAQAIHNLRLVSHRIKFIATAFLVQNASVCLSTQSFAEFEELCSHPEYRQSIRNVSICASYYDSQLAADPAYFCERASTQLYQRAEMTERTFRFDAKKFDKPAMIKRMFSMSRDLRRIERDGFTDPPATTTERNLMDYHVEYQKRTQDQEELRRDNNHLRRLCQAIRNLPALETINLYDGPKRLTRSVRAFLRSDGTPDDLQVLSPVLDRERWSGSFDTAYRTNQPLEMLGELLAQLGRSGIRPRSLRIDFSVPTDLHRLKVDASQSGDIQHLASQLTDAGLRFSSWARKDSLAENNDRSTEEMCALGSLSRALTSAPSLRSLALDLENYPVFYQVPTASMIHLLPIETRKWTKLHTLRLTHVPVNLSELELLSRAYRGSITSLTLYGPCLLTGDWDQAIDVIRELDQLEEVDLKYPNGGRYGYRSGWADFPEQEVRQYLLKQSSENPLEPVPELPAT